MQEQEHSEPEYQVVINDEEQYSIWPTYRDLPSGWYTVGKNGSEQACLDYIETVWTDMRPRSLREFMQQQAEQEAKESAPSDTAETTAQ